jgi:hypothetical protein
MAKIVRHEFLGNWIIFWLLCIFFFLIPFAFLYWMNYSIRIEEDLDDPERFVEAYRSGQLTKRARS